MKYPGAKWRIAKWIVSHLPPHKTYLEPYFGSGAVFFTKTLSRIETINDLDGQVTNLFRVIRDQSEVLARILGATPWARAEYQASFETTGDPVENARRFLVRCWQAYGVKTCRKTGWRSDVQGRRGMYCVSQWDELPEWVLKVATRLKNAQIENQPALEVIDRYRYPEVLVFADPPYPLEVRNNTYYRFEMTDADHVELLNVLDKHPGPVLLSGYACPLYDNRLKRWTRLTCRALAEGGRERQEVLWLNPVAAQGQQRLEFEVTP